jgi:hypothetical protein
MSRKLVGLCLFLMCLCPSNSRAQQCPPSQLIQPYWHGDQHLISAFLPHPVTPSEQSTANWTLVDMTNGAVEIALEPVTSHNYGDADHPNEQPPDSSSSVYVGPKQPLLLDHLYYLSATKLKFHGCQNPQANISPTLVLTKFDPAHPYATSPSTSRDDSDFYFAPTVDGASGSKASYTLDSKLQYRRTLYPAQFGTNTPYRPGISFVPGLDAKISSNPKQDGNSVLFQVPLEVMSIVNPISFPTLSHFLPAVISRPGFVAEADKNFHNINGIFSDGEYFVVRGYGNNAVQVVPEPMIGFETGSNLKAQQVGTYPDSILRANFGLRVVMTVFQPAKAKPLFSIESNYIRRLFLHPEPVYTQDSKGNQVLSSVGTNPRDHADVKLTYNLTTYVGLSLGYEYGELPPVYTKVDNKYTFGITFKGQLQYKPVAK